MGRSAVTDILVISSTSSSSKPLRHPSATHSRVVPSCSEVSSHSSRTSSHAAQRLGTGWPSASEWVNERPVEKPKPPASIEVLSSARISASCSGVASFPTESSFITMRRIAECPTIKATLMAVPLSSTRSRYSAKLSQFQGTPCSSASRAMPSTLVIMCLRYSPSAVSPSGASEKPQLPATIEVTPKRFDGVEYGSQKIWAS